jgi:hypothetical protein
MDPFLESNVLKRMAQDMEVDDNELNLATFCYLKRCRYRNQCGHGGSVPGQVWIHRDHFGGHLRIVADYFLVHPVYTEAQFQRRYICYIGCCVFVTHSIQPFHKLLSCRFHMCRHLFECPVGIVQQVDEYFVQRPNCIGEMGLSALQKVVAAIHIHTYGVHADVVDEYVRIGESTTHEALQHFCKATITAFASYYLRKPTPDDVTRLLEVG